MQSLNRQFDSKSWLILIEPVVFSFPRSRVGMRTDANSDSVCIPTRERGNEKNKEKMSGFAQVHSRDGPIIFHTQDGLQNVTGPSGGTGPPQWLSDLDPPKTTDPPKAWLVRKKC